MNRDKLCDLIFENAPDEVHSAMATESSTKNDRIGWKGAMVVPDDYRGRGGYFTGQWVCDGGIHFFYKKECALAWMDYMADGYGVLRRKNNYLIRRQEYLKKLR